MTHFYDKYVVPHLIRIGCGCQMLSELRRPIVAQAQGRVLELGVGAGANMSLFKPDQITEWVGIEPSDELRRMALSAPGAEALKPFITAGTAEHLPFDDHSFDTVLCTFTLCSVDDPQKALSEAYRVLRPGGRFLFCEHGRAPDSKVARWQDRIDPLWSPITGGCHLNRPVRDAIQSAFTIVDWEGGYQSKRLKLMSWIETGCALVKH